LTIFEKATRCFQGSSRRMIFCSFSRN
jgi:hypothetical protein